MPPEEKKVESFKPVIVKWRYRENKRELCETTICSLSYLCNHILIGVIRDFSRNLKGEEDAARLKEDATQQMASRAWRANG
jgi:hypothetical protein